MKQQMLRLGLTIGLVALLGGCAASWGAHEYHPMYPEYANAEDLTTAATDIVIGVVESSEVRKIDITAPSDSKDPAENPTLGAEGDALDGIYVYTVLQLRVEDVRKGDHAPGDVIEIKQLGGSIDGKTYVEEGATALSVGSTYGLFLMSFRGAPASLLNSSQASYLQDETGTFTPVTANNPIAAEVAGLLASSFRFSTIATTGASPLGNFLASTV